MPTDAAGSAYSRFKPSGSHREAAPERAGVHDPLGSAPPRDPRAVRPRARPDDASATRMTRAPSRQQCPPQGAPQAYARSSQPASGAVCAVYVCDAPHSPTTLRCRPRGSTSHSSPASPPPPSDHRETPHIQAGHRVPRIASQREHARWGESPSTQARAVRGNACSNLRRKASSAFCRRRGSWHSGAMWMSR